MGLGLLHSLIIPLLIFPSQEGCGRHGVFARNSTLPNNSENSQMTIHVVSMMAQMSGVPRFFISELSKGYGFGVCVCWLFFLHSSPSVETFSIWLGCTRNLFFVFCSCSVAKSVIYDIYAVCHCQH